MLKIRSKPLPGGLVHLGGWFVAASGLYLDNNWVLIIIGLINAALGFWLMSLPRFELGPEGIKTYSAIGKLNGKYAIDLDTKIEIRDGEIFLSKERNEIKIQDLNKVQCNQKDWDRFETELARLEKIKTERKR